MITAAEKEFVATYAYVPEHLPGYVTSIARAQPYLLGDYLCYRAENALIFIGYPLRSPFDAKAMLRTLKVAVSRFTPGQVALIAPAIPIDQQASDERQRDHYYRLDVSALTVHAKVSNMIRRASRELHVERGEQIGDDHMHLISEFLSSHALPDEARYIYERIPDYVSAVDAARLFTARGRAGNLVAFDVVDFGAGDYAFYQFNFCSKQFYVPGASDLLLHELVRTVRQERKAFINLGLGIHPGVIHFKEKWGGTPFLTYEYCRYRPGPPRLFDSLLQKL